VKTILHIDGVVQRHKPLLPTADNGLRQHNPCEVVRLGQDAMARQRRGWDDWMAIAEALDAGRIDVMHVVNTNEPRGRRYEKAMAEWLLTTGFKEIDKGARNRLLKCLEDRTAIEKWR